MTTQTQYSVFHNRYGTLKTTQLISPRVFNLDVFMFPLESIFHYLSYNTDNSLPNPSHPLFKNTRGKILLDHITDLHSDIGKPRRLSLQKMSLVRSFHSKNTAIFRFVEQHFTLKEPPQALEVLNYGLLNRIYVYPKSPMQEYQHIHNINKTALDEVAEICKVSSRNNFIALEIPQFIPSLTSLDQAKKVFTPRTMNVFDTPEKLFILEIWKWLDDKFHDQSVFSVLSDDELAKVNLIITYKKAWSLINLNKLREWRLSKDHNTGLKPFVLQRYFLRMLLSVSTRGQLLDTPKNTGKVANINDDEEPVSAIDPNIDDVENNNIDDKITVDGDGSFLDEIERDLAVLEELEEKHLHSKLTAKEVDEAAKDDYDVELSPSEHEELRKSVFEYKAPESKLREKLSRLADLNVMSSGEYRAALKQIEKVNSIKNTFTNGKSITEFAVVKKEDLTLDQNKSKIKGLDDVIDKSMTESSLRSFDSDYINKVLPKDIAGMILSVQNGGVMILNHEVEKTSNVLGSYENHTLQLKPLEGVSTVVRFRFPVLNEDGTYKLSGNKCYMRKQRGELPIRKMSHISVALTSYYGKVFVERSVKKVDDTYDWLARKIITIVETSSSNHILKYTPANVFDNKKHVPKSLSSLAMHFKNIKFNNMVLEFDKYERYENSHKASPFFYSGITNSKDYVLIGSDNIFYKVRPHTLTTDKPLLEPLGDIFSICLIDKVLAPVETGVVNIYGKKIPLGIAIGYFIGIKHCIKLLKTKVRVIDRKQRSGLTQDEYEIVFQDKKIIASRNDAISSLILSGFHQYKNSVKHYKLSDFESKEVYLNVLEAAGMTTRIIRELDNLNDYFIDPITKDLLTEMKEPETFLGLLIRSAELLTTDYHPDELGMENMRIKGYERFAGALYKELMNSVKDFRSKGLRGRSGIEMNPHAVLMTIARDQSASIVQDINPINNLKEQEAVTFVGEGGRSKETMVKPTRKFDPSDCDIISEASVDSGDVGINTFLSHNPRFSSLRGTAKPATEDFKPGNRVSMSMLLSPAADTDDTKRVGFISIQQAHTVACVGYRQPQFRTGGEIVVARRTTEIFAYAAKNDGEVVSVDEKGIVVKYVDGSTKGVELGIVFGRAEGTIYPHRIKTLMSVGQKFLKDDVIAYNSGFFEEDFMHPGQIIMKSSLVVETVIMEAPETLEDASGISLEFSKLLTTSITKEITAIVDFKQGIGKPMKAGASLVPTDILFIVEEETTAGTDIFDERSLETLAKITNKAPKAKVYGRVDKIEVFYNGDKNDMSPSLRAMADASDRDLKALSKSTGKPVITGEVNDEYRVGGTPITLDKAVVRYYVTVDRSSGVGDKGVFCNQLKSTHSEVFDFSMMTESGIKLGAKFGAIPIGARIVCSPDIIGTTQTLLEVGLSRALDLYDGVKR